MTLGCFNDYSAGFFLCVIVSVTRVLRNHHGTQHMHTLRYAPPLGRFRALVLSAAAAPVGSVSAFLFRIIHTAATIPFSPYIVSLNGFLQPFDAVFPRQMILWLVRIAAAMLSCPGVMIGFDTSCLYSMVAAFGLLIAVLPPLSVVL